MALPLAANNLHEKFGTDRANTVVCIMPTRFHRHGTKVDL